MIMVKLFLKSGSESLSFAVAMGSSAEAGSYIRMISSLMAVMRAGRDGYVFPRVMWEVKLSPARK